MLLASPCGTPMISSSSDSSGWITRPATRSNLIVPPWSCSARDGPAPPAQSTFARFRRSDRQGGRREPLGKLSKLEVLSLSDPQITDLALAHLQALKQLKTLRLENTRVSDAGLKKLREALPKCDRLIPAPVKE